MNNRERVLKAIKEGHFNRQRIVEETGLTYKQVVGACGSLLQAALVVRENPYAGNSRVEPVYRVSSEREKWSILNQTENTRLRLEELKYYPMIENRRDPLRSRPFSIDEDHYGTNPPKSKWNWSDVAKEAAFVKYHPLNKIMNYSPFFVLENYKLDEQ